MESLYYKNSSLSNKLYDKNENIVPSNTIGQYLLSISKKPLPPTDFSEWFINYLLQHRKQANTKTVSIVRKKHFYIDKFEEERQEIIEIYFRKGKSKKSFRSKEISIRSDEGMKLFDHFIGQLEKQRSKTTPSKAEIEKQKLATLLKNKCNYELFESWDRDHQSNTTTAYAFLYLESENVLLFLETIFTPVKNLPGCSNILGEQRYYPKPIEEALKDPRITLQKKRNPFAFIVDIDEPSSIKSKKAEGMNVEAEEEQIVENITIKIAFLIKNNIAPNAIAQNPQKRTSFQLFFFLDKNAYRENKHVKNSYDNVQDMLNAYFEADTRSIGENCKNPIFHHWNSIFISKKTFALENLRSNLEKLVKLENHQEQKTAPVKTQKITPKESKIADFETADISTPQKTNTYDPNSRAWGLFNFLRTEVLKELNTGLNEEIYITELKRLAETPEALRIINSRENGKLKPLSESEIKSIIKSIAKYYAKMPEGQGFVKPKYEGSLYQRANEKKKKGKLNRLENIKRIVKDLKNPTDEEICLVAELFSIEETLVLKYLEEIIRENNKKEREEILRLSDEGYKVREIKKLLNLQRSEETIKKTIQRARKKKKALNS